MKQKLDKINLRVLYELDRNCRTPLSDIGKVIRKTPQYVKYRVGRLKEEGVIKSISLLPTLPQGYFEVYVCISLQGMEIQQEQMLLDYLFKIPESYQVLYCDGSFSILVSLMIKDATFLQDFKTTLKAQFLGIREISFASIPRSSVFQKKYLIEHAPGEEVKIEKGEEASTFTKKVLLELSRDPMMPLLELAQHVGTSYDKIKYVFRKGTPYAGSRLLLSDALVKKTMVFVDFSGDTREFEHYASAHPNITQLDVLIGRYTHALYFESMAETELARVIKESLYRFKDSVQAHEKVTVLHTYKWRWLAP